MNADTLHKLWGDWIGALVHEAQAAMDNGHVDASHDLIPEISETVSAGPDAYLADAREWFDEEVDALRGNARHAADILAKALKGDIGGALLTKLADGGSL